MRFVKVVFIFVIVAVVAVAASVTYITQVLDPNDLKPTLVNSAKKQQVRLELQGNITWAFWPWFGISVEKVRASSANSDFEAERRGLQDRMQCWTLGPRICLRGGL